MQVIVDNLLITYSRSGKGKQVIILHGWADQSANWQSFARGLAKKYEVIVPDLPGFGGSQAPHTTWGLHEYAALVAAFVQKLGLQPYAFIGHSNGGGIAIRGLASNVLRSERLVLLASAGIRGERQGRQTVFKTIAKTGKILTAPLPAATKKKLRHKLYATAGSDMLVAEHMQETYKKIIADDVRADAAMLTTPTLLVYGEQDDQTPVRYGQMLHELIADSTLEILLAADHFLYKAQQTKVLKLIEEFLR